MAGQTRTHTCLVRLLESHSGLPYGGWEGQQAPESQEKEGKTREGCGQKYELGTDSLLADTLRGQLTLANWAAIQRPQLSVRASEKTTYFSLGFLLLH